MQVKEDEDLSLYTTIRIGGKCNKLYFPETSEELKELLMHYPDTRILGAGSNLLINDRKEFDRIICLRHFLKNEITLLKDSVYVGAGVRLQQFIKVINENGYGGIEYLFSVPGLIGGAIYMNAGRGKGANEAISDYLVSVDVIENGKIVTYSKDECLFGYRFSVFQNKQCVIISAIFRFDEIDPEEGVSRQKQRISLSRENQDNSFPNLGTTFCKCEPNILKMILKLSSRNEQGVHFSRKCANWLQNRGQGTFDEAINRIALVEKIHKIFGKECRCEYTIWH